MQDWSQADFSWSEAIVVRLLRRWVAARECDEPPLSSLVELSTTLGLSTEATVALDSFFQLIEGALERPLYTECCCSQEMSPDERAILLALVAAPELGAPLTSAAIPHGFGGPLAWAAARVRGLLGMQSWIATAAPIRQCPFSRI